MKYKLPIFIVTALVFFILLGMYILMDKPFLVVNNAPSFGNGKFSIQKLPEGWTFLDSKKHMLHKASDVEFASADNNAFGMVIAEDLERELASEVIKKLALSYPQKRLQNFMIHHEEINATYEKKVEHVVYSGDYKGTRYTYAAWYVIDKKSVFQIITWTTENNFKKYLDSFQKIFDNFSLLKQVQ